MKNRFIIKKYSGLKTILQGVRRKTLCAKYEKNARMAIKIDTNNKRVNFSQRWNNLYGHNFLDTI